MRLRQSTLAAVAVMAGGSLLAACGGGDAATAGEDGGATAGSVSEAAPLYDALPADVREAGVLTVGSQLASPPIVYLEADAETVSGVNVDLAEQLSEELGVPITFQQTSFDALTPSLTGGKIDAVFDMMGDTEERQATVDFVDFMHNGLTYLVAEGNPDGVETVADLCGRTISGVRGTSLVTYAEEASAQCEQDGAEPITVKQFASASDARLQVQNGRSTAFLGQTPIMIYLADTTSDGGVFDAVVDESYPEETVGMAVAKDSTELRDVLQQALQAIIDNGDYAAVLEEYGLGDLAVDEATVNAGA